jgi:hypothetical protein
MENKTVLGLPLISTGAALADGDVAHIIDASDNKDKQALLLAISEYTLKSKTIPATGTAIVTDTATQTMTNKTLTSPKINSATTITANGADINKLSGMTSTTAELSKLHGVTASTAEINHLTGVTSSIQTQISQLISQSYGITNIIYHYSPGVVSGVTSQIINEATLREEYGISSGFYRVDPDSISVSVYKSDGGRWYLLPPVVPSESSDGQVFFTTTTAGLNSQTVLNSIDISLLSPDSYRIVVNYKVLQLPGV